ncbi:MAG TPA: adenylate/guanylate cyclase domain-containing protein [Actinomycetota bacterium]|nr:adenylate/guanylate cyclase domain-containing protein [Actinomycetota bacterium]
MPICGRCGEDNPARARFCLACGSPLAASGVGREVRKTVTVVFSDLVGFTPLGERLDPESLREVMTRFYDRAAEVLARHGGTVTKFIGDAVMAVYGIPRLHEDDALRAVRGAAELAEALAELNGELEAAWGVRLALRTGVNTGEVVVGDAVQGQEVVVGDAVNVAARLEQAAAPGQVLIGERTWRLVRDAATVEPVAPLALKGKGQPVAAFRLLGVRPDTLGHARHLEAPMVGRSVELGLLDRALRTAVAGRACHLALVLGPAGVGKSRLVQEFLATVEGQVTVLRGRCVEYGEGLTFLPIAEVIRQAATASGQAGLRDLLQGEEHAAFVVEGLAGMAGTAGQTASREEVPWAVRRLFEVLARGRPLIVVVDDLHWAQPALLDLLEQVARSARDAPILIVGMARPELLDDRPDWGATSPEVAVMTLEPLGEDECARLIRNLLGGAGVSTRTAGSIARAAGGNPLFIEELIAELIDQSLLVRSHDRWEATADLAHVPIPAGVSALLAARLDRLEAEERAVLERASVIGQVFDRQAVAALSPAPARPGIGPHLAMLARRQLIRAEGAGGAGDADAAGPWEFRFRHLLIRDVTYEALPKRRRAELHERLAGWLGRDDRVALPEHDEIAGHHFEQAYRYLEQLGRVGPREVELARRGATRLASGGRRAMGRDDPPAAVNLLSRALDLLPTGDPDRVGSLLDLGDALAEAGEWRRAHEVLTEAVDGAQRAGDPLLAARGRIALLYLGEVTRPRGWTEQAELEAGRAIALFEQSGDRVGLAHSWRVIAHVYNRRLQWAELERVGEGIVAHARRAGDRRTETRILAGISASLSLGPTPAGEAVERCEGILAELGGAPRPTMMVLDSLALCSAMLERFDEAERLLARADAIRDELTGKLWKVGRVEFSAWTYLLAGRPGDAERVLRPAYETFARIGEKGGTLVIHAALLAEAISALGGRDEEAEQLSQIAEVAAADSEDVAAQGAWRMAQARVLARKGSTSDAERLAREAAKLAAATQCPLVQTSMLLTLARVLLLGNRPAEARQAAQDALAVAERKGDLASSSLASTLLGELR